MDLCAICRQGLSLEGILHRIPEKYRTVTYPSYHILRALVYFTDAEKDEAPQMITPMDWPEVKEYFSREVPGLLKKL